VVVLLSVDPFTASIAVKDTPTFHQVHKALHRPLTVCGVDRRLFFLALLMGAATFNLFYSFLAGLLVFAGLYAFARWATGKDPRMLQIVLASSCVRRRYDPGKHEPFGVEVVPW
jgi:type IV secretory pathway TrbD component